MHTLALALRSARRRPALSSIIILTIALGISLTTVVVSIADRVLFRELPYRDASRLMTISTVLVDRPEERSPLAAAVLARVVDSRSFSDVGAMNGASHVITTPDGPSLVGGAAITPNVFEILGTRLLFGQGFSPRKLGDRPQPEAVLSHGLWRSTFGGDRSIIGRSITLSGNPFTVVGVTAPGITFPNATAEIWTPLDLTPFLADEQRARRQRWFTTIARLAPNVTPQQAQSELTVLGENLAVEVPLYHANERFRIRTLREWTIGDSAARVRILLIAGLTLLAVACANAASVLWANAITRRGEFAIRAALGASRIAVARQLAAEGLVLGLIGGAVGLIVAPLLASSLRPMTAPFLPAVGLPVIDMRILIMAIAACVVCGVLLGALPSVFLARGPVAQALRAAAPSGARDRTDGHVRGALLVMQTSLCVALLVSAGLLIKSFVRLQTLDIGIDTTQTLTFEVGVPRSRYTSDTLVNQFYERLETELAALPGVRSVASTSGIPMAGGTNASVGILGRQVADGQLPQSAYYSVSDSYFDVVGMRVRRGRVMSRTSGEHEIVVNETMARQFWPAGDAIGAQVRLGPVQSGPWGRVVGIVSDVRDLGPADSVRAVAYGSHRQYTWAARGVMLRVNGDPATLANDVRRVVRNADPSLVILRMRSFDEIRQADLLRERVSAALLALFAAGALVLAIVGVYGLTSAFVAARTREFGIRIALGARDGEIVRGAMRRGAILTIVGIGVGLTISAMFTRLFASLVHGISSFDPFVYGSVALLLASAALAATWAPARRAARVDPMTAFRSLGLLLLAPIALRAQLPRTMTESFSKANEIIDAAIAAHGGVDALRAARHVRVTFEGYEYHRLQSRRVAPPYDSTRYVMDYMYDLPKGRLVVAAQTRGYPGGFYYTNRFITAGTHGFSLDLRNQFYTTEQYPPADQQVGNLFRLPQFTLLAANERVNPGSRRWLGRLRLPSGAMVDVVSFAIANNGSLTLGFDPQTHRLRSEMSMGYDPLTGETEVFVEYLDYRMMNGILLPERRVQYRGGDVINRLRLSATPEYEIPDSLLAPPPSFTVAPASPTVDPVRELAPGVWALGIGGSSVLLVAFSDHAMVVDASSRFSPDIIARAATLARGKPIRYSIPTHHHDDHLSGTRSFAAAGATIVTTPGNLAFTKRMLAAPRSKLFPNGDPVLSPKIETITEKRRVFTDGSRTVEIHDVGPNEHAEEMLVAWLPAEGILFHADLIEIPRGVATRGSNAQATMQFAGFIRGKGWNVRTLVGAHGSAASPAELDAIVRLPILPPE